MQPLPVPPAMQAHPPAGLLSFPVRPFRWTPSSLHWAWSLAGSLLVFVECVWTPAVFKYLKGHHVGEGLVLT